MMPPATRERGQRTEPPLRYSAARCPAREHDHADPRNARRARLPRPTPAGVAVLPCARARSRATSGHAPRDRPSRPAQSCTRAHGAYFAKTEGGHARNATAAPFRVAAPPCTDTRRRDCGMHAACRPPRRRAYRSGCGPDESRRTIVCCPLSGGPWIYEELSFAATYDNEHRFGKETSSLKRDPAEGNFCP